MVLLKIGLVLLKIGLVLLKIGLVKSASLPGSHD
jgi:hypothetical protein